MTGINITNDQVLLDAEVNTREDALRLLAKSAVECGFADDATSVFNSFLDREGLGSTGLSDGVALPHAKSAQIKSLGLLVMRLVQSIDWPGCDDGRGADIIVALLLPEGESGSAHLDLLAQTAALLVQDGFRSLVRSATSREAIASLFNERL